MKALRVVPGGSCYHFLALYNPSPSSIYILLPGHATFMDQMLGLIGNKRRHLTSTYNRKTLRRSWDIGTDGDWSLVVQTPGDSLLPMRHGEALLIIWSDRVAAALRLMLDLQ